MEQLITVFTGVVVAAFAAQTIAIIWMARSVRSLSSRLEIVSKDLSKNVKELSEKLDSFVTTVKVVADKIQVIEDQLIAASEIVHKRVALIDSFLEETTVSVRKQIGRIQGTVDNASRQVEQDFESLHRSILAPFKEINAIVTGIRVGLDYLLRRRRNPAIARHQDEEMFI